MSISKMPSGPKKRIRLFCAIWGGLDADDLNNSFLSIKLKLNDTRKFVRHHLRDTVYDGKKMVSVGTEVEQDRILLAHVSGEIDAMISECISSKARVEAALQRVIAAKQSAAATINIGHE